MNFSVPNDIVKFSPNDLTYWYTQFPYDDRENVYFILSSNWKYESLTIV